LQEEGCRAIAAGIIGIRTRSTGVVEISDDLTTRVVEGMCAGRSVVRRPVIHVEREGGQVALAEFIIYLSEPISRVRLRRAGASPFAPSFTGIEVVQSKAPVAPTPRSVVDPPAEGSIQFIPIVKEPGAAIAPYPGVDPSGDIPTQ